MKCITSQRYQNQSLSLIQLVPTQRVECPSLVALGQIILQEVLNSMF